MHKLKKTLLIFISIITILTVIVFLFISPIIKYIIEKYDEKYTGRQITIDRVYANPFTGYINFNNLKIYELKNDSVFISANDLSLNIAVLKLFSKTYEISELTLNHPRGIIIQNGKDFNFNDLIKKFSPKNNSDTVKAPVHFNILNVKIKEGEFYYRENLIPINYFVKKLNLESTGKRWNTDTISAKISFLSGIGGGNIKGDITVNLKNKDYHYAVIVHKFGLNIIEQYLKDLTNYGNFSANLDADIKSKGNLNDEENVTTLGLLVINDFHLGKSPGEDYASFEKLTVAINELSPLNHKFLYDSVSLIKPFFKYERYDYLDNLQTMFGKKGSNIKAAKADEAKFNLVIEIGRYLKVLAKNFFRSQYKINRLAIYQGNLKFNDFSISEKFSVSLDPLYIIADSIDKNHKRIDISLKSGIKPYGNAIVTLGLNPKDSADFDIKFHFQKLPLALFNPYTISYTSFPLDRGTIELNGRWNVRNGIIQGNNHLVIIDPRVAKRLRNKDIKWIPLPLIMSFVRERGNVIDYEIPITGNLKSPDFHLQDVIFHLLENIFVKPATTPYRIRVKNTETEIEKSLTLKWQMGRSSLLPDQQKFIEKMAGFLEKTPGAFITVYPQHYTIKEKEYILFFEAKKKYFLLTNTKNARSFNEADSEKVDKMSVKDSLFIHYLNKKINDPMIFTIQEKCARIIHPDIINAKLKQLNKERANAFMDYFKKREVDKRVKISMGKDVIPYNGFSFYKIEYKDEFPESLIKAYQKMNELNEEAPREKFKKDRKKNRSPL